jgi:protein ImuB
VPGNQPTKQTSLRAVARAKELSSIIAILHKWGVHTLGDLAALPPDQLGARLGPAAVRLWEQATGRATRLLQLVRPREVFVEEIEFDYEIETAEPLLFILRRFLQQLTLRLGALYLVAQEMTLRLTFADPPKVRHRTDSSDWRNELAEANKSQYEHRFHIPDPTNSVEILFRLLQTHLETFRAKHPIVAVSLMAEASRPARQQFHLFETPLRDPNRLHETLTRLTGLLGKERIGRPVLQDTHRPDAFQLEAFSWQLPSSPSESAPMIGPALRRLRAGFSPAVIAPVVARQGPYRTSGDWWDAKKWERTEWDLQLADGGVCRCREGGEGWSVEGIYD